MKSLTIAVKLYLTMITVGVVLLVLTLSYSYRHEEDLINQMAVDQATALTSSYFESVNTLMLAGAMAQQDLLHQKMLSQANVQEIKILRAPSVSNLFGEGKYPSSQYDKWERAAIEGQPITEVHLREGLPVLTLLTPIVMTQDHDGINCLMCHISSKEGEIGGATRIDYSLADAYQAIKSALWQQALLLTLIFSIGILALALVFKKSVVTPLKRLRHKLAQVSTDSDLTQSFNTERQDEIS